MSNFSQFFPIPTAGGTSSTISKDPSTMDRNITSRDKLVVHVVGGTETTSTQNTFWDSLTTTNTDSDPIGSYISMPAASQAYQTIVDLSYPGVGGKLFNVIGPCQVTGAQQLCTFKITIDGTATEIVCMMIFNDSRPLLGDFLTGRLVGTTYPGGVSIGSTNTFNARGNVTTARGAFNGFSNLSISNNTLLVPGTFSGFSYITFEDTCKVEIKNTVALNTAVNRNNAAALYLLN